MNKSYVITFLASVVFVIIAFVFQDKLSQFKSLGLLGIFLINFFGSATIFFPAPAILSVFAGGLVYSPLAVAIVSAIGATLGDMIGFLLGYTGKQILLKDHKDWYIVLRDLFYRFGGIIIFLFAFIPNPLFDGVGIIAGALGYSPYRFFAFLFVGRFLRDLLLAYFGSAISR